MPGDTGFMGLVLPASVSVDRQHRTLVRLCSVVVPAGMVGRVLSIGQLLTIAACVPALEPLDRQGGQRTSPCDPPSIHLERPVITPWWTFPDGNVSWHLRTFTEGRQPGLPPNPGIPTWDNSVMGTQAAIMVAAWPPAAFAPTNAGIAPGLDMSPFGTWHSMDFSWPGATIDMAPQPEFRGPGVIAMFASVYQTDPSTRPAPAVGAGPEQMTVDAGLVPEDRFLLAFPDTARYYRIGGRMVVEIRCDEHEAQNART